MATVSAFEVARHAPLREWWERLGLRAPAGQKGNAPDCPVCGPSSKGRRGKKVSVDFARGLWKCFSCGAGGDVIDLVARAQGASKLEAARLIAGETPAELRKPRPRKAQHPRRDDAEDRKKASALTRLAALARGKTAERALAWLIEARKLPREVVAPFLGRGIVSLEALPRDAVEEAGRAAGMQKPGALLRRPLVFLYRNAAGVVVSAEFRSIGPLPQGAPKSIRLGRLHAPWSVPEKGEAGATALVEGVIDALSLRALGFEGRILAVPGVSCWRDEFLRHVRGELLLALDADDAGDEASDQLAKRLRGKARIKRLRPKAKDWNDMIKRGA